MVGKYSSKAKSIMLRIIARIGKTGIARFILERAYLKPYRDEIGATRSGIIRFRNLNNKGQYTSALLRRNIHRLEKGLIMRPRRDGFAIGYIAETVEAYKFMNFSYTKNAEEPMGELEWARDVLEVFFSSNTREGIIGKAYSDFSEIHHLVPAGSNTPRKVGSRRTDTEYFEEFEKLVKQRISVRWFLPDPVSRSDIDRALELARCSPSACNRQPFRYVIISDPEKAVEIARMPLGARGFADNVPALAILIGNQEYFFDERDRHVIYIDGSLSAMNFLLGLEVQGLGGCVINWPDIPKLEKRLRNKIPIEDFERVVMFIALGYPDPEGSAPNSRKKDLERIRSYHE